jgi:hypothetical protein
MQSVWVSSVGSGELLLAVNLPWDVIAIRFFADDRHLAATTLFNNFYLIDHKAGVVIREMKTTESSG